MSWHDLYRHISASNLTVSDGATTSTGSVSAQTRFVRLCPLSASSTPGGVYYAISSPGAAAVDSTTGTYLPANWVEVVKITPGQMVQARASSAIVTVFNITQETD